jgi:hypothetical protein
VYRSSRSTMRPLQPPDTAQKVCPTAGYRRPTKFHMQSHVSHSSICVNHPESRHKVWVQHPSVLLLSLHMANLELFLRIEDLYIVGVIHDPQHITERIYNGSSDETRLAWCQRIVLCGTHRLEFCQSSLDIIHMPEQNRSPRTGCCPFVSITAVDDPQC